MSKGEKTIFFLSLALAAAARYLFVDDVVHFLDPHLREVFLTSILRLIEEKQLTVIMASQSAFEIEGIPERVLVMEKGRIILDESVDTLKQKFVKFYGDTIPRDIPVVFSRQWQDAKEMYVYPYLPEIHRLDGVEHLNLDGNPAGLHRRRICSPLKPSASSRTALVIFIVLAAICRGHHRQRPGRLPGPGPGNLPAALRLLHRLVAVRKGKAGKRRRIHAVAAAVPQPPAAAEIPAAPAERRRCSCWSTCGLHQSWHLPSFLPPADFSVLYAGFFLLSIAFSVSLKNFISAFFIVCLLSVGQVLLIRSWTAAATSARPSCRPA